jgi:hypothetical protein
MNISLTSFLLFCLVECMDFALSNLHVGQLLLGFQHNLEQYWRQNIYIYIYISEMINYDWYNIIFI